ncbi:Hypothetical predicted protein [Octopus vulgaris]|uniref:Uncharacterized protein n=1 Tax=Octopus vulgaris TaxID=6645 RepID=A0AA36BAH4_OCTVU|nr:Hypothetical predicted protein [Octopus vulgaris]
MRSCKSEECYVTVIMTNVMSPEYVGIFLQRMIAEYPANWQRSYKRSDEEDKDDDNSDDDDDEEEEEEEEDIIESFIFKRM